MIMTTSKPRILVVDDQEFILEALVELLEPEGYNVITASGKKPLPNFANQSPEIRCWLRI